jgi:hypothetical protein
MALKGGLNKFLWGVSFISKVFSNIVLRNWTKKSRRFLWKIGLSGLLNKKWSFLKQIDWSTILVDKRWTSVFSTMISKCFKKFLFITKDHMYTINVFTQAEQNSLMPSLRTTSWVLVWPSFIATRTPFRLKIKW